MSEKKQERLLVLAIVLVGLYYTTRAILWWGFGIGVPEDIVKIVVKNTTQNPTILIPNFIGEQVMKIS